MKYLFSVVVSITVILLIPTVNAAQHFDNMYDNSVLVKWQTRYQASTYRILNEGIRPFLTPEQKSRLANVSINIPLKGKIAKDPFCYYAYSKTGSITMSALSLKFLDDICTAYAWLWYNDQSISKITDYVGMMRYKKPSSFPGNRYPTPYEALGIPSNALDNPNIDQLALRLFNSARAFILCHELGHVYHQHPGNAAVASSVSIANEKVSDKFAIELLRKVPNIPMGAVLYFQIFAHWDWDSQETTHPISSSRMLALAQGMEDHLNDFAVNPKTGYSTQNGRDQIHFLVKQTKNLAKLLKSEELQSGTKISSKDQKSWTQSGDYISSRNSPRTSNHPFAGKFSGSYIRYTLGGEEALSTTIFLQSSNAGINGTFDFGLGVGVINNGVVKDNALYFDWYWAGITGRGIFYGQNNGKQLSGTWGYKSRGKSSANNGGKWQLSKTSY